MNLQFKLQMKKDKFKRFQIYSSIFSIFLFEIEILSNGNLIGMNLISREGDNVHFLFFSSLLVLINVLPFIFWRVVDSEKGNKLNNEIIFFIFKNIIYISIILVIGIIFMVNLQYTVANSNLVLCSKAQQVAYIKLSIEETFFYNRIMEIIIGIGIGIDMILFNKCYEWNLYYRNKMLENLEDELIVDNKERLLNKIEELNSQIKKSGKTIIGVLGGIVVGVFIKDIINLILQAKIWLMRTMAWSFIPIVLIVGTGYIVFKIGIFKNIFSRIIESDSSKKRKLLLKWEKKIKII